MSATDDATTMTVDEHADSGVKLDGTETGAPGEVGPVLPPLAVSAVMVTKANLISALRVYLPRLTDVEMIDHERFLLSVGAHDGENGAR